MSRSQGGAPRKPATKFPNLRKKIDKAKIKPFSQGRVSSKRKPDAK